jgi:hypothetical protein
MIFKDALERYKTLKQEITDLSDAIQLINSIPAKKESTNIAINVLKVEKEKKDKELIRFENYFVNDCIAESSC